MSRRIEFSIGEYYHLYNRGVEKRTIFLSKRDYDRFVTLLYISNATEIIHVSNFENVSKTNFYSLNRGKTLVDIGAYCLMPNHFHLLVREKVEDGISLFMQKLLTAYTMYFNKKNKRKGSLFEGTFQARHVDDDVYLKYLFSYIHLNPVKLIDSAWKEGGIKNSERAKKYLSTFTYSSYPDYVGETRQPGAVLTRSEFPTYFETLCEFELMVDEWLNYNKSHGKV